MPLTWTSPLSRHARRICIAALLCTAPAFAAALDCSEVVFRDLRSTVCRVDIRTDHLQLFLKDAAGTPLNSFKRLAQSLDSNHEQLLFAMNAGMYRDDYSPLGLFIANGHEVHRINMASGYGNFYLKPNGVFVVSTSGARLVETDEYRTLTEPVTLATQSGPLLVRAGQINSVFDPQGTSKFVRNGVGVVNANEVVFAITEQPVNFYDFALLFRDRLQCADALYLDGNVSSLYARSLGRDDELVPLGPIIAVSSSRDRSPRRDTRR